MNGVVNLATHVQLQGRAVVVEIKGFALRERAIDMWVFEFIFRFLEIS